MESDYRKLCLLGRPFQRIGRRTKSNTASAPQLINPDDESSLYPDRGRTIPFSLEKEGLHAEVSEKEERSRYKMRRILGDRTSGFSYTLNLYTHEGRLHRYLGNTQLDLHDVKTYFTEPIHDEEQGDDGVTFCFNSVSV